MRNLHNIHKFCIVKYKACSTCNNVKNDLVATSSKKTVLITEEFLYKSYLKDMNKTIIK